MGLLCQPILVGDLSLTIGDIVKWQEPDTLVWHEGFLTPYTHFLLDRIEHTYYVISATSKEKITAQDLINKLNVEKIGEL